jgi:mono/diheme cytochrome c family protein
MSLVKRQLKTLFDRIPVMVGLVAFLPVLLPLLMTLATGDEQAPANKELKNPYLGQKEAIEEGERIYRSRCVGCHKSRGGSGPNLFKTKLTDKQFLETVMNGRKGTNMPSWSNLFSTDDVWKIHAFVMSRDQL